MGNKKPSTPKPNGGRMKRLLYASAALALIWFTGQAKADMFDPLQFTCSTCAGSNGSFVPVGGTITGLQAFAAPANSGDLVLKILVPTQDGFGFTFTASGTSSGSFQLFSSVNPYTSGSLEVDYLHETLAPSAPMNNIGTFLDQTNLFAPGTTGYFLYQFDAGQYSLDNQGGGTSPVLINIAGALPVGAWMVGDLFLANGTVVSTATSEGLVSVPGPIAGAGLPGLAALGMTGLAWWRRKRRVA